MKIIKVEQDLVVPPWVIKSLKGCKKTSPYVFKAINEFAMDTLGDLAAWCQKNGSPQSKVINSDKGRYIKIADPLCRGLELANIVQDSRTIKSDVDWSKFTDQRLEKVEDALALASRMLVRVNKDFSEFAMDPMAARLSTEYVTWLNRIMELSKEVAKYGMAVKSQMEKLKK